jgi:GDP-L-fucose synthase
MVGSAIVRQIQERGDAELILRTRAELDLTNQQAVAEFFKIEQIDEVYLAAAKVGGIIANNTYPANFIYENLMIECNIIHSAHVAGIQKLLFLGSSCIYPKLAEQPMAETALLTAKLEETNEPYAIAKIAGIKLCESYNRQYGRDYRSEMLGSSLVFCISSFLNYGYFIVSLRQHGSTQPFCSNTGNDGVRSCILHIFFFKLWLFYSYLV